MPRALLVAAVAAVTTILAWLLFVGLPRWSAREEAATPTAAPPPASAAAEDGRKIKARLFYVAENGTSLTGVEQDVPYREGAAEQAKAIMTAQLAAVAAPLVSAIPPGTSLRALFVTANGEAYVDFSRELVAAHPGGSTNELLTVYTIVQALTANLPGITAVQVLVDGKEVETLAGHVDLRNTLKAPASVTVQ